jgi:hypothetical protein
MWISIFIICIWAVYAGTNETGQGLTVDERVTLTTLGCPKNTHLVGLYGSSGMHIDQIGVLCRSNKLKSTLLIGKSKGGFMGLQQFTPALCPLGSAVSALVSLQPRCPLIKQSGTFRVGCTHFGDEQQRVVWTGDSGKSSCVDEAPPNKVTLACPPARFATALVLSGANNLWTGLNCKSI